MDRVWLLTWTTYGTWMPGDRRGFVSPVPTDGGPAVRHNLPGTPYDANHPDLLTAARSRMLGDPVRLTRDQAVRLVPQFRETARHRDWRLLAAAVMGNHVHLVVGVPGDPEPADLLRDFKAYGGRMLNRDFGKPAGGTWWTESGSRRKLPDERAVRAAVAYVRNQANALAGRFTSPV
ncbi:MAG: transposase [Fimbriiglobus sp.]